MIGSERERGAPLKNAILIAGPTASGKSALALEATRETGGVIVNTDSMQVYSVLRVVTARPGEAEMKAAPHRLYGHVDPAVAYSTGAWFRDVEALIDGGVLEGRRPIFVGGTGLYFRALLGGLSQMPDIPDEVRERWRDRLIGEGAQSLHLILTERDPQVAARLRPNDGQRIARALEVLEASGRSISEWQAATGAPLVDASSARRIVIAPDRAVLTERIDQRFERMMGEGAMDEVRQLMALHLDPALPAMKAIGVPELAAVLDGTMRLDEAVTRAKVASRQYAKRQLTWFRNQLGPEWLRIEQPGGDATALWGG